MTRTRLGLALSAAVLGLSGLVGLTAGGTAAAAVAVQPGTSATPSGDTGSAPSSDTTAGPSGESPSAPDTGPGSATPSSAVPGENHGMGLGNILHGEGIITTKQGTQTVAVQHGTVTAISDASVTLKSSDGYTKAWSFGKTVHVIEHRKALQPTAIKIGTDLGVAGPRQGTSYTASLVIVSPA
jgi:hypothetical protein